MGQTAFTVTKWSHKQKKLQTAVWQHDIYQELGISQMSTLNMQYERLKLDESIASRLAQTMPLKYTRRSKSLKNSTCSSSPPTFEINLPNY